MEIEIVTEYFEYSREEIIKMVNFDYTWSPHGKHWYDEKDVMPTLTPHGVMRLWKYAEELNKQLLEALQALGVKPGGYCFCFSETQTEASSHTGEYRNAQAAIAAAEGE